MKQLQYDFDNYYDSIVSQIKDEHIRRLVKICLENASNKFRYGSSGHFPGKYGLYKHTKVACNIAETIMDSLMTGPLNFNKDVVLAGCILHDIGRGFGKDHAHIGADYVEDIMKKYIHPHNQSHELFQVIQAVRRHMGRWGSEHPVTIEDWIVHLSDNISSKIY